MTAHRNWTYELSRHTLEQIHCQATDELTLCEVRVELDRRDDLIDWDNPDFEAK